VNAETTAATPRVLDTYGLTYAFTALLLIPGLFAIDRWSILIYSPAYLALISMPFLLGPAIVFLLDSKDGLRTVAIRSAVLSPLVAFTGVTFVFVSMLVIVLPVSMFLVPENFGALTLLFVASLVLLAAPLLVSLVSRIREGVTPKGALQIVVLSIIIAVLAWMIAMTFAGNDTLATFINEDVVDHFVGAFTWYLPSLALAAGLWRRVGLI